MVEKEIYDKDGVRMMVMEFNGRLLPYVPTIGEKLAKLKDMEIRKDDILICGFPRSGTNWVWEVITMLLTGVAENSNQAKIEYMLEYRDLEHLDKLPSPRVLNSHLYLEDLPNGVQKQPCKLIYVYRNPKDVAVSLYHFIHKDLLSDYQGSWDALQELILQGQVMYGSWIENIKTWDNIIHTRNDLNIFPIAFEDLKMDFSTQVRRLASFLGVTHSDDFYEAVERKCNFQNLKAAKDKCFDEEEKSYWRDGIPAYMRKGSVGDWKNTFTVAQNEIWDNTLKKELKDIQIQFKYSI